MYASIASVSKRKYIDKRDRFLNVAEARTNSVLNSIRILGHCANRQLYEYTPDEVSKIFRSIEEETHKAKLIFSHANNRKRRFKL